jgi:repressor LexA
MGLLEKSIACRQMFYWIGSYIQINGYPPSIRDIKDGLGYHSTSAVRFVMTELRNEGYINWIDGKARTITITKPL